MKRTIKLIAIVVLLIAIFVSMNGRVYAEMNPRLSDIVNIFNSCKVVKLYNQDNTTMNLYASSGTDAEGKEITLTIHITENGVVTDLVYNFSENVLTANYTGGDTKEREYWIEATNILIDCIEQYHGYAEGEMFETLNSNQIVNYTLENQGLMISKNSPNLYLAQINVNKEIPTFDTNSYIKESDLTDVKDNLTGDGIAKLKKGKALYYKYTVDNKDILIVGEQEDFTYIINKSIQSILKVMFNSDEVVKYYKQNYPSVDQNKTFQGFKIEVNPIKNTTEETVFGADNTYQFVRITINREEVKAVLEGTKEGNNPPATTPIDTPTPGNSGNPGTGSGGTSNNNTGVLPKTGESVNLMLVALYSIFIAVLIGILIISFSIKVKRK